MEHGDGNSRIFCLRVWGRNACFTRPEMKVERVSYDVMTPSAARAILEAVLWKPAIQWTVTEIDVLKPVEWESVRRNEIDSVISSDSVKSVMAGGQGELGLFIEEHRQQRAGRLLRDVAYLIHAFFRLTDRAGAQENVRKFEEIFERRASKGQCFHRPYLGCREFSADFELDGGINGLPAAIDETRDLGWMLHDLDFTDGQSPRPRFFHARMESGRISVPLPDSPEVRS